MTRVMLQRLATALALVGGALLLVSIGMSLISMVGRRLWSTPISGDIELLQMMIAVAVACFLPLCEMNDRHIRVDIIANLFPNGFNSVLLAISHLMLALISALLTWRLAMLMADSLAYNAQSVQLGVPEWIPQAGMLPGIALLGLCALYQGIHQLTGANTESTVQGECP